MQELAHPNAKGQQMMFDRISEGLGTDGFYSEVCNEIVFCPGSTVLGAPHAEDFITGVVLNPSKDAYDVDGNIGVAYMTSGGKTVRDTFALGGKAMISINPAMINLESAIITNPQVTIHSIPVSLGLMSRQSDGTYRLDINEFP